MTEFNPTNPQEEAALPSSEGMATVRLTTDAGGSPEDTPAPAGAASSATQPGEPGWAEVSQDWREVGEEFKKLGTRLSTAIQAGWKSEQEQQLNSLGDQLRAMADQVEAAVRSARQEARSPETRAQTQRVVEAAKGAQATLVDEVRETVAAGLRALNAQLRELADRIEKGRK